jgi:hypothetical protein
MRTKSILNIAIVSHLGCLVGCSSMSSNSEAEPQEREQVQSVAQAVGPCDSSMPFTAPVPAFKTITQPGLTNQYDGLTLSSDGLTAYLSGRHLPNTSYDIMKLGGDPMNPAFTDANAQVVQPVGPELTRVTTSNVDDRAPFLRANGLTLYLYKRNGSNDDIYVSTRTSTNVEFAVASPVSAVNSAYHDQDPFFLETNQNLFFASQRDNGIQRDLYRLQGSSIIKLLNPASGAAVNTEYEEWRPVLASDGLTLYFASGRPGGIGNDFQDGDIYVATRASLSTPFSNVTNVATLNSSGREFPVAISADNCTLYFASNEYTGLGGTEAYQLFQATRQAVSSAKTMTLRISGTGSVTQGGFNCSHTGTGTGGSGTCVVSAPPNTVMNVTASGNALWQGACTAVNFNPGSTGVLTWAANDATCDVTF